MRETNLDLNPVGNWQAGNFLKIKPLLRALYFPIPSTALATHKKPSTAMIPNSANEIIESFSRLPPDALIFARYSPNSRTV
jgi:hypothetical protein